MLNPVAQLFPSTSSRSEADLGSGAKDHRAVSTSSGVRTDDKQFPLNDHRYAAPSRINWLCNSSNASSPIDTSLPRRPPTAHALGRSASSPSLITAQAAASPYRHASLMSNQSLQLDMAANRRTAEMENNLTLLHIKPLTPIAETRSPTHRRLSSVECSPLTPGTPASVDLGDHGSTYSAFLKRSLKRTVSQASSSSLRTTGTTAPTAPTLPPLDLRPPFIMSHRTGPQLFSTVYEDANSERTGSFVTAEEDHTNSSDAPPTQADSTTRVDVDSDTARRTNPSFTHELTHSPSPFLADADAPPVPRSPQSRSSSFIWDRWRKSLSFGSARPSFSLLLAAGAGKWRANVPVLLFWAGFAAPWCWLIGGWLVAQGEAQKSPVLPLWKARGERSVRDGASGEKGEEADAGQVPEGAARRLWKGKQSMRVCMRWSPFTGAPAAQELTTGEEGVNVIEEKEARVRGAWVMRCRIAAFVSGLLLTIALVVALVVAGRSQ